MIVHSGAGTHMLSANITKVGSDSWQFDLKLYDMSYVSSDPATVEEMYLLLGYNPNCKLRPLSFDEAMNEGRRLLEEVAQQIHEKHGYVVR